jgi:tRNA (cytidine32/uridine32-2'-O)-methyltransferase
MAVQVICYEVLQAKLVGNQESGPTKQEWDLPFADSAAVEHFYDHLEATLIQIGFHDPENPRQLMTRLRRLFNRVRIDQMEVNILRGFLTAINRLGNPGEPRKPQGKR